MKKIFYSFVLLFTFAKPCNAQVLEQDSLAMVDFFEYNGLSRNGPVSTWGGVTITGNRVTAIDKQFFGFGSGGIALGPGFSNLTALKKLKLFGWGSMCQFGIPAAFSNLTALEEFSVSAVKFDDAIAATFMAPLFSMTNLTAIELSGVGLPGTNQLTGDIPAEIANLVNLKSLNLSYNSFGAIPPAIFNCPNLEEISFYENYSMYGGIPDAIGNCTKLKYLNIAGTEMNGTISSNIGNCTELRVLNTAGCSLTGEIPASMVNCRNLSTLKLGGNFTGVNPIIQNIGLFTNMDTLQMGQNVNQTPHSIPGAIGRLSRLSNLYLTGIGFSGSIIPDSITNCTSLKNLTLTGCNFTGRLPEQIGNLTNLTSLNLSVNSLTGPIPVSIFTLNPSLSINLSTNLFTFDGLEQLKQHFTNVSTSPQPNISIRYYGNRLSVSAGGTLANNTYKWYRGGVLYTTVTGDSTLTTTLRGTYYVEVTNSIVTGLTLTSSSIYVPLKLCPPAANTSLTSSSASGTSFQWQMNDGTGYINISDNANFSGTTTPFLELINIPSAWNGYLFRCFISNSYYSSAEPIKFETLWTGSGSNNWEDAGNWNCSAVPDSGTDVVITSGTVVVNSNTSIRSLSLSPGASLTVSPGVTLTVLH